jgi:hypothetical protein
MICSLSFDIFSIFSPDLNLCIAFGVREFLFSCINISWRLALTSLSESSPSINLYCLSSFDGVFGSSMISFFFRSYSFWPFLPLVRVTNGALLFFNYYVTSLIDSLIFHELWSIFLAFYCCSSSRLLSTAAVSNRDWPSCGWPLCYSKYVIFLTDSGGLY